MAKITAFSRIQHHGVTDPLSGATIPTSNDHTDGSWTITDIYDRELMINVGNGNLQYRAGGSIYNVQTGFGPVVKSVTIQITNWDMSTVGATDAKTFISSALVGKTVVGMDAFLIPDPTSILVNNRYKYNFQDLIRIDPLQLQFDITTGTVSIGMFPASNNYFRWLSDSVDATFADGTNPDRGWIIVSYLE